MSIEQSDRVDAVGVDASSGKVILTISDDLDWSDESSHLLALQDKLNAYLQFIESGELLSADPDATRRKVVIDVVTRLEIPTSGLRFLEEVRPILGSTGIELRTRVLPD